MSKKNKPSMTSVRRVLLESLFDPRKPSAITTIVSERSEEYLIERAIEVLQGSKELLSKIERGTRIRDAISILAAARLCGR